MLDGNLETNPPAADVDRFQEFFSRYYFPVARVTDVSRGEPVKTTLLGKQLVLAMLDGEIAAFPDVCRHFQAALSNGKIEHGCRGYTGDVLRCTYHGWAYARSGQCVEIPQLTADRSIPPGARIGPLPVRIAHDLVWVSVAPSSVCADLHFPELDTPGMASTPVQYAEPWDGSLVRMILSALDDYHFPWLHEGVLGTRDKPLAPVRAIERLGQTLVSSFAVKQPSNVTNRKDGGSDGGDADVGYTMVVSMPNVFRIIKRSSNGGVYVVQFFPLPLSVRKTGLFWRVSRNYDVGDDGDARVVRMEEFIQSQDRGHVGGQRPWLMAPLPLRGVDDALMAYLRWLGELGAPVNL
jgi:phenylpropionate dioxygenase-like ring-hydroxylating dioxygenase large terminal subunit